jgi:hypothetical protein
MADRGFTISEDLFALRVKLNIPAFMKGRSQLTDAHTRAILSTFFTHAIGNVVLRILKDLSRHMARST